MIASVTPLPVGPAMVKVIDLAAGPSAADIVLNITTAAAKTVQIGIACDLSTQACGATATLSFAAGGRAVTLSVGARAMAFPLLPGETTLPVRVMTDLQSVEVFVGGGRGVYSGGLSYAACAAVPCAITATAATATSTAPAAADETTVSATAWAMSSIFDRG